MVDGAFNEENIFQTVEQNIREDYKKIWAIEKNDNITPLAVYDDEDNNIALAVTDKLGYNSVYCGIVGLPAQFLRNVLKNSGIHLYLDSNEIMETDDNFLAVGVCKGKVESIKIKDNEYLIDIFNDQKLVPVDNIVKDTFEQSETKLYRISNSD